jgi:DHA1 family bicyclomycin/chloramphenicol resistance-like MFS transporter
MRRTQGCSSGAPGRSMLAVVRQTIAGGLVLETERQPTVFMPLVIVFVAVSLIGSAMYTPSLPAIAADLHAPVVSVQLTLTVYLIGYAFAQVFVGSLSDRLGRRPIMIGGFILFVLASVACSFAPDINFLIGARLVQSLGASVGVVLTRSMIRDCYGPHDAARYMAYVGMASGLTPTLSPMVGGFVQVGFGWRGVFHAMTILGVLALLAAVGLLRETLAARHRASPGWRTMAVGYATLARDRRFLAYAIAAATPTAMFFVFLAGGPIVMIGEKGVAPDQYGFYALAMPAGFIMGNFLSSHILPSIGIDRGITIGNIITVAACAIFAAIGLSGHFSPLAFALPIAGMGFGNGLAVPAAFTGAVGADPKMAGTASGLAGFVQMASAALVNPLASLVKHGSLLEISLLLLGLAVAGAASYRILRGRIGPHAAMLER